MSAAAIAVPVNMDASTPRWEKLGNFIVLLAYFCVVLFTVRYHEKWADEAQAWLIARDLPLGRIWFYELRYEGSPGLWHTILWIAQHWFHAPYSALGYIGVAFALAGVAVLVFTAPFPWYVRWPLAFTYVMIYQYAVIARPYTLLPLLCFLVAILFKDMEHPERMTVVLVLLAMLTLHGAILAACFGLLYLIDAIKSWQTMSDRLRNCYFICAAVMVLTFLFLFIILKPTSDVEEIVLKQQFASLPDTVKQQMHVASPYTKLSAVVSGAFLDFLVPSTVFLLLSAGWFATRRQPLVFVLPVGMMLALYAMIHGAAHHHGTAFVAAITAFWIAWPTNDEQCSSSGLDTWARRGVIFLLWVLCFVNIWDAAVVVKREYLYPYSGAKDAADYLKSIGADRGPIFGLLFGVVGVDAYFDHNIFVNLPAAFFHHGFPLIGTTLDLDLLQKVQPQYIVTYSMDPKLMIETGVPELTSRGYELVHFSDGYYLYKRAVFEREVYFIFRRIQPK